MYSISDYNLYYLIVDETYVFYFQNPLQNPRSFYLQVYL